MPWVTELRFAHRAFRRMALRCYYHLLNPGPTTTESKRTRDQALANEEYGRFLAQGVKMKGLTQAMADGPFAITPSDTAWLTQILHPPVEGAPKRGFWSGPF